MSWEGQDRRQEEQTLLHIIEKLDRLDSKLTVHMEQEETKFLEVSELVQAWKDSKAVLKFIRVLAYIGGVTATVWLFIHNNFFISVK